MDSNLKDVLRATVYKYFDPNKVRVFVFGSRASGNNLKYSDIDLGLESESVIPYEKILSIEEDLENSNIPYVVDIVDFSKVSEKFKEVASKNKVYLN